jgi:hypothetical protein
MVAEQLPSVEEVVSSVEAGRQRLADADPIGASRAVLSSARDAIPEGWPGHKRPSRWPWVTAIILGTTLVGVVVFMAPTFQRYMARAKAHRNAIAQPPTAMDSSGTVDETTIETYRAVVDPFSGLPMEESAQ